MGDSLAFSVEGKPRAWKRTNTYRGRRITDAGVREQKHAIGWMARSHMPKGWRTDALYQLHVRVYRRMGRGGPGDCDNYGKLVADALQGVAYSDDRQVVEMTVTKYRAQEPRTEVFVRVVSEEAA